MDKMPLMPLTEDEIHTFADGQLSAAGLSALQARLALDPTAKASVARWQQQRNALQGLYQGVRDEVLPAPLLAATRQAVSTQQSIDIWRRWGAMAAGVFLAFGMGWFANTAWRAEFAAGLPSSSLTQARAVQDFARQAGFAHAVYAPEVRHPVEVSVTEQAHLVQWLSKRLERTIKIPNLTALGFDLVGGRLLPGDAGARAQFMFQNAVGLRITLYLGAVEKAASAAQAQETGFQFSADGPIPSFYWIDQGFGYALAGPVPRTELMQLAETVHRQL